MWVKTMLLGRALWSCSKKSDFPETTKSGKDRNAEDRKGDKQILALMK